MNRNNLPPRLRHERSVLDSLRPRLHEYMTKLGFSFRREGSRLLTKCPIHADENPSLAIYGANHDRVGCYPCGFSLDVFDLAQLLDRANSFPAAVEDVASVLGENISPTAPTPVAPARKSAPVAEDGPSPAGKNSEDVSDLIHTARLAWSDAFYSGDPIIDEFSGELGISRNVLQYAARGRSGLGILKGCLCYLYPTGINRRGRAGATPRFLWEVGKAECPWRFDWVKPETKKVYLTESESDALALIACGYEKYPDAAVVASPGTAFRVAWAPLFKGKHTVIAFDFDEPGRTASEKVANQLLPFAASVRIVRGKVAA